MACTNSVCVWFGGFGYQHFWLGWVVGWGIEGGSELVNGGGPADWVFGMFGDVCRYSFASCVVVYARQNMGGK